MAKRVLQEQVGQIGVMETVSDAINRLCQAGYTDDYRAEPNGLRAVNAGCVHAPEALTVDHVMRFEGPTDPDEEAIVFALGCRPHGIKGTYATSYGPKMSPLDAEMVPRLSAVRG
jgi:hypothetical protein